MSHPNGVAATQFRLLVTSQDDETDVFLVDALGFQHAFGTLPAQPAGSPSVQEIYLAISPGLGGFTANDVYACRGNQVLTLPKVGGAGSVFADFSTNGVPNASHCGIVFDETGAFGDNLIVTYQDGSVWEVTSAGTKTLLATLDNGPAEGPSISASGLLVAQEDSKKVWSITPGGVTSTFALLGVADSPESTHVIPSHVCTFGVTQGAFFSTDIHVGPGYNAPPNQNPPGTDFVLSYSASDFTGLGGNVLVPLEGPPEQTSEGIYIFGSGGGTPTTFDSTQVPHEGSNFVDCAPPPPPSHCTLTQGGYKNHYNYLLTGFPPGGLTLGAVFYTDSQLNSIIQNNSVHGNGLISLAHQLITAELNIYYGSIPSPAVVQAIASANTLIGGLVVPPIGNGYLAPSLTSGLESTLDRFNSSNDCGCH